MPELVVIGLDALDPFYLQRWVGEGCLPTFQRLMENGVFGKLESTIPPVTLPAWPAMFTGKNPGKLGVFDFFDIQKVGKGYTFKPFSPARWRGSYVWDILGAFGKRTGVVNFPELFTSYEVNGFMVNTRYGFSAWPKYLQNELKRIFPNFEAYTKDPFRGLRNFERNTLLEWRVDRYLRKKFNVDLLIHVFRILDVTLHHSQDEEELKNAYIKMDKQLGEYLDSYKDENILIVSDHGSKRFSKKFYVNSYLREMGYLKLKDVNSKISLVRSLSYKLLNILPGKEKLFSNLSDLFARVIGGNLWPSLEELFATVDWSLSKVFAYALTNSNFMGLWLLKKNVDLERQFLELEDPNSGRRIVKNVFYKKEIYSGAFLEMLPDMVIEFDEEYLATSELGPRTFCKTRAFAHRKYGTFMACGRDFGEKVVIDDAHISDIAPTILHIINIPIPQDMDGRVLKGIFKGTSRFAKKKIRFQKPPYVEKEVGTSKEDLENIKKRLRMLGYM